MPCSCIICHFTSCPSKSGTSTQKEKKQKNRHFKSFCSMIKVCQTRMNGMACDSGREYIQKCLYLSIPWLLIAIYFISSYFSSFLFSHFRALVSISCIRIPFIMLGAIESGSHKFVHEALVVRSPFGPKCGEGPSWSDVKSGRTRGPAQHHTTCSQRNEWVAWLKACIENKIYGHRNGFGIGLCKILAEWQNKANDIIILWKPNYRDI